MSLIAAFVDAVDPALPVGAVLTLLPEPVFDVACFGSGGRVHATNAHAIEMAATITGRTALL
jgi:hypothetical protein